jgi:hypothetical protein
MMFSRDTARTRRAQTSSLIAETIAAEAGNSFAFQCLLPLPFDIFGATFFWYCMLFFRLG